jgi:peptidylglycine monooxygenase
MQGDSSQFENAPICASESRIVYAWAMDAPELHLPPGVGFKVGGDTDIKWLVLQVHYKDVTPFVAPNNGSDHSGVTLVTSSTPQPKRAGVYLMGTGGEILPHSVTYMETACGYTEPFVMHPFAFRTHAHTHGRVVSGYRIRDGEWLEIGRMSPQKPQMFYNVTNPGMTVKSGDVLAARCTMVNDEDRTIRVGATGNDEMCNFYIMYYVDADQLVSDTFCFTEGPPSWDWSKFENGLIDAALAPLSASVVPGTDDFLAASDWLIANRQRALLESERLDDLIDSIQARQPNDDEDEEGFFENEIQRMQNPGFDYQPGN